MDRTEFDRENHRLNKDDRPALAMPVLQGITKASLQTNSFIWRLVPGDDPGADRGGGGRQDRQPDGVEGECDRRRLIPAGTGAVMNRLRAIASGRDQRLLSMGTTTPQVGTDMKAAE